MSAALARLPAPTLLGRAKAAAAAAAQGKTNLWRNTGPPAQPRNRGLPDLFAISDRARVGLHGGLPFRRGRFAGMQAALAGQR